MVIFNIFWNYWINTGIKDRIYLIPFLIPFIKNLFRILIQFNKDNQCSIVSSILIIIIIKVTFPLNYVFKIKTFVHIYLISISETFIINPILS